MRVTQVETPEKHRTPFESLDPGRPPALRRAAPRQSFVKNLRVETSDMSSLADALQTVAVESIQRGLAQVTLQHMSLKGPECLALIHALGRKNQEIGGADSRTLHIHDVELGPQRLYRPARSRRGAQGGQRRTESRPGG